MDANQHAGQRKDAEETRPLTTNVQYAASCPEMVGTIQNNMNPSVLPFTYSD